MAKYGAFKYGSAKYGHVDSGRKLSWGFEVDWFDTGIYTGYNEAFGYGTDPGRMFSLNTKAGRQYFMNADGNGFQPVDASQMQVQLTDMDGRYDPYNSSGPLYQYILPGKKFRLTVMDESTQTKYPVMVGRIEDIRPSYSQIPTVTITGRNGIEDLKKQTVNSVQVYTTEKFTDAIGKTLLAANWTDGIDIDTTVTDTMGYWWLSGNSAFSEIQDLTDASRGLFCVSADGKATFLSRLDSPDPVMTFVDNDALLSYGVKVPTPWESIKNYVKVYSRTRMASAMTLWTLNSVPFIVAGSSITVWAEFNSTNGEIVPATIVTTPVATTDYTANSAADGSGTNRTANISITKTTFATSAKLVISNTGLTDCYLTLMQLRGTAILSDDYTFAEDSDATSIQIYRQRELDVKTNWLQDIFSAQDYAETIVKLLAVPKQFPRFVVRAKPSKQFVPDLFDIVSTNFVSHNITGDFRVGYIEHNWVVRNGDIVDTTYYLEPNIAGNITGTWIFPAMFGLSTVF